ncbi:MAG TPA: molybdenum cofactor guanylyltransferase MobA [Sulfurimonas sp.]|nr:molybdenum cofactor guanylyltransferase MobA [Sulfurimonas sp.]
MSLSTIPCIIFAGGKSSRMGTNKALLPFGPYKSLISYQVQRLQKVFKEVYISTKDQEVFSGIPAQIIEDTLFPDISAPSTGFINIFKRLKDQDCFFVLSVDAPFVSESLISKLLDLRSEKYEAIIVRTPSGIHPLCGIYSKALEKKFKEMIEKKDYKLKRLLDEANVFYMDVEDEKLLSNLNTPQQYKEALVRADTIII